MSSSHSSPLHRVFSLSDFSLVVTSNSSAIAEEKRSKRQYAIKIYSKNESDTQGKVQGILSKKRIFLQLTGKGQGHPFLVNLHSCFHTADSVYFVSEYVHGGSLRLHLPLHVTQVKLYSGEVLLALEYIHSLGIIYRNLKLDNILLASDGHIKVADYSLCKTSLGTDQTASTSCGNDAYMAPEILLEQRYTRAVDWWAFGVLLYQMLLSELPFRGDNEDEIFDATLQDEPFFPTTLPPDSVSIIVKLLKRDPLTRLGSGLDDAVELKKQAFFADLNFDDILHKRVVTVTPYIPVIDCHSKPAPASNADNETTENAPILGAFQEAFKDFTWTAPWA